MWTGSTAAIFFSKYFPSNPQRFYFYLFHRRSVYCVYPKMLLLAPTGNVLMIAICSYFCGHDTFLFVIVVL